MVAGGRHDFHPRDPRATPAFLFMSREGNRNTQIGIPRDRTDRGQPVGRVKNGWESARTYRAVPGPRAGQHAPPFFSLLMLRSQIDNNDGRGRGRVRGTFERVFDFMFDFMFSKKRARLK